MLDRVATISCEEAVLLVDGVETVAFDALEGAAAGADEFEVALESVAFDMMATNFIKAAAV